MLALGSGGTNGAVMLFKHTLAGLVLLLTVTAGIGSFLQNSGAFEHDFISWVSILGFFPPSSTDRE
jgi:hypothetical protein